MCKVNGMIEGEALKLLFTGTLYITVYKSSYLNCVHMYVTS